MEIITGVERRRRRRDAEKLRILAELDEPGTRFNDVARRHDLSRGLLWQWRGAQRRGKLAAETPAFVRLQVVPELPAPEAQGVSGPTPSAAPSDPDSGPAAASGSCCPTARRCGSPKRSVPLPCAAAGGPHSP